MRKRSTLEAATMATNAKASPSYQGRMYGVANTYATTSTAATLAASAGGGWSLNSAHASRAITTTAPTWISPL
ncbi:hypothetical protein GCM10020219_014050 [Nonomuraea dietziae]